ncbi:hypothetical protein C8J57DRAFT_491558 [Mycena rebaudengoi]|nr:hypothetical protein C8J57DRAFT_491558 [Mycena rebaudengoi]
MSLRKIGKDEWTETGVKSTFQIDISDGSTSAGDEPLGKRTSVCGLGWCFSCTAEALPSSAEALPGTNEHWISVYFHPHLIRKAEYGRLSFSIDTQNLRLASRKVETHLVLPLRSGITLGPIGLYTYSEGKSQVPIIWITVTLPTSIGLSLPSSVDARLVDALVDTMDGDEVVDLKFYAFSAKGDGYVSSPRSIFAKTSLLTGFSDSLDSLISGGNYFTEANLVDLDRHKMDERDFDEYDYSSDSDLDPEETGPPAAPPAEVEDTVPGSRKYTPGPVEKSLDSETMLRQDSDNVEPVPSLPRRMGRVVVVKSAAFKTWKALLHYLYTKHISFFGQISPQSLDELTARRPPKCSAKSMYRLAHFLELEELKSLSLAAIRANMSQKTIVQEAFSQFTSRYEKVQEIEVEFIALHFDDLKDEIDTMLRSVVIGERPFCVEVLSRLLSRRTRLLYTAPPTGRNTPKSPAGPCMPSPSSWGRRKVSESDSDSWLGLG